MPARKNRSALPPVAAEERSTDTAGAAELIGLSPRTLQDMRLRGTGPQFIRVSKNCVRYRLRDLTEWQQSRMRTNTVETDPFLARAPRRQLVEASGPVPPDRPSRRDRQALAARAQQPPTNRPKPPAPVTVQQKPQAPLAAPRRADTGRLSQR